MEEEEKEINQHADSFQKVLAWQVVLSFSFRILEASPLWVYELIKSRTLVS